MGVSDVDVDVDEGIPAGQGAIALDRAHEVRLRTHPQSQQQEEDSYFKRHSSFRSAGIFSV
jgi:hypothetical protein